MDAIIKQGNLCKRSGGYSMLWQDRTFQLYAGRLDYSVQGSVKGTIQLVPTTTVVELPPNEAGGSKFGFKITSPLGAKNELFLRATSDQERLAWVGTLRITISGGDGSAANVFAAAMGGKIKPARPPMTEDEAANVIIQRFKNRAPLWKQRKLEEEKKAFERDIEMYHEIVCRPIRCFKRLNNETEFQERWVWLDMTTNSLYWAKKNPIENGDDAPDAPPVISEQKKNSFNVPSVPTTTDTATAMLSKASLQAGLGALEAAAAPAVPSPAAVVAKKAVVEVTEAQASVAGSKSFVVKEHHGIPGYVTKCYCRELISINPLKDGHGIPCAQLILNIDPDNAPPSLMSKGKSLVSSMTGGGFSAVELYIPHDTTGTRMGSAYFYISTMRKVIQSGLTV